MTSNVQNLFSGKMVFNGTFLPNTESKGASSFNRLVSGLRVNGDPVDQTRNIDHGKAISSVNQAEAISTTATDGQSNYSIVDKFASEILNRLQTAKGDGPAASLLAGSLSATATEIKNKFGQEKANEFMSQILTATDGGINEQKLSVAVSSFFGNIGCEAMTKPELLSKLESMKDFLNGGLELTIDENEYNQVVETGQQPGLSYSLNKYFGTAATIAENKMSAETKGFNSSFERINMQVNAKRDDPFGDGFFIINSGHNIGPNEIDVSNETVEKLASFLRNDIGNEDAAVYLEQGSPDDFLGAVATSMSIVVQENGQEAAHNFMSYLNRNVSGLMQASNGVQMEGWHLSRDFANPDAPIPSAPPKDLWITNGQFTDALMIKKHQGLTTNWRDSNGVMSEVSVDLNELYASYKTKSSTANSGNGSMNNPSGNLVNTIA